MTTKTLLTADELERMPDDDSVQIELDEGELITMPPAGEDHSNIEVETVFRLKGYAKAHDLGRVYGGDAGFRLSKGTVRSPDVAFIRKERVKAIRGKGFIQGAPDLAVEIFSASNSLRQLTRKVKQYLAAACHTVWVIHPERREVYVYRSDGTDSELGVDDSLEAPDLLPGFSLKVAELFE
jgi:Uma2 family endonuclease